MSKWFEETVNIRGGRMHYYRTGGDKPLLLLLHGVTDDGLCWTPLATALQDRYDIIMLDAWGHGGSDENPIGLSYDQQTDDLAWFFQELNLRAAAVGGHSMGAVVACYLAARYSRFLRCAFLEDPPLRSIQRKTPQSERDAFAATMEQRLASLKALSPEALAAQCRRENPAWSDAEIGPWVESKRRARVDFASLKPPRSDWREIIPMIRCSTLLITGDPERGAAVTPEQAEEAHALLPWFRVTRIQGAGHNIRRDEFAEYLRVVRKFLEPHD